MSAHVVAAPASLPLPPSLARLPGAHDFDFLFGRWQVRNERLRERLVGCTDWDRFEAHTECRPVLGGAGNLEQFETDWNGGLRGLALRLFDPATQRWSIHWASDRGGALEPAVVGGFKDGVGDFFGPDQHRGIPVLSRYRWSQIEGPAARATRARWDQAFSTDAGQSWETNWVMHFTRIAD